MEGAPPGCCGLFGSRQFHNGTPKNTNNRRYKIIFMKRFINRTTELAFLKRKYNVPGAQFVVIYGRRRVGKTELLKQFCSNKSALYLLADKRGTLLNLERFAEKAADHFGDMPRVYKTSTIFSNTSHGTSIRKRA